ncbi:unnamed protein product [Blepharisma stoltei]|uniref:Uncharacterized protein n=1 Tax=Blepharisma stoltei TaxID=1481888 RepID=A0AAU9IP51_9CILI|nr:unnamed protein product [Blepharisma stoltei]
MGMLNVLTPFTRMSAYRKSLGNYSYKIGGKHAHKKPGLVPLHIVNNIKKTIKDKYRQKLTIAKLERESKNLYGEFVHKGFRYNRLKTPIIEVPDDIDNFELKPYVSCHMPRREEIEAKDKAEKEAQKEIEEGKEEKKEEESK